MKVLFTNSGRRTYMIEFAKKIIKSKIFISDSQDIVPTFYMQGIKKFILTRVKKSKKNYIKKLILIVKKFKIKKIIPLSDHDLLALSENKFLFDRLSCDVIISRPEIIKSCMNKKKMYFFCKKNKINTPISFFSKNIKIKLPLVRKKLCGSGGSGFVLIKEKNEINKIDYKNFFLQKKIDGIEYGIDIFNDPTKKVSRICIKKKLLMRSGETDRCILVKDKKINTFAKRILSVTNHYGNMDCDVIKDKRGKLYLIDLNPRFGGGYPATHISGMNFLKYILTNGNFFIPKTYKGLIISKGISLHSNK